MKDLSDYIPLYLQGKLSPEEERELLAWREESAEHRRLYQETCRLYYRLHGTGVWEQLNTPAAIKKFQQRIAAKRRKVFRFVYGAVGTAAVLALGIASYWLALDFRPAEEKAWTVAAKEEIEERTGERKAVLTLSNGEQVALSEGKEVFVDLQGAQVREETSKGLVYSQKDSVPVVLEYNTLSVPRSGEYMLALSDGSRVWVNSESVLRYPVAFGTGKREVFLSGEAYFEVAKDAKRPFIVHAGKTATAVLGTSFNVKAYRGEEHTAVTLVEGAVAVSAGGGRCRIAPGQQVKVDNETLGMERREVDVATYVSWKDGLFDFDKMPLEELAVQLSRWYDVDFFFASQEAAGKCFTGAVKRNRSLRFMLDFIEKTSGVRFEMKGQTVCVYHK